MVICMITSVDLCGPKYAGEKHFVHTKYMLALLKYRNVFSPDDRENKIFEEAKTKGQEAIDSYLFAFLKNKPIRKEYLLALLDDNDVALIENAEKEEQKKLLVRYFKKEAANTLLALPFLEFFGFPAAIAADIMYEPVVIYNKLKEC